MNDRNLIVNEVFKQKMTSVKPNLSLMLIDGAEEGRIPIKTIIEESLADRYITQFNTVGLKDLKDPVAPLTQFRPNILILDLGKEKFDFKKYGAEIKHNFPGLRVIVLVDDSNIRQTLWWLEHGADHLVYKGRFFLADFAQVLENAVTKIEQYRFKQKALDEIFFPDNFPVALFQLKSEGPAVLMKDFEDIPNLDVDIPINHFLDKLAIEYLILTGQGHTYHESVYILPAGSAKSHVVLVFSFRLDDPKATDDRIRVGYFQLCIFVPSFYLSFFPPIPEMMDVIPKLKNILPDADALSEEALIGVKYAILNHIRKLVERTQIKE